MTEPTKQYPECMCDIETFGMGPDGAIVGIAAAMFDLQTQEIGPTFKRAVNLATSVEVGMSLKPSTIMFWMGQPEEARRSIMWNTVRLTDALTDFNTYVAEHSRPRDLRMYGNAPSFDLVILQTAYRLTGIACPWHYTNERDFRTIRAMYPSVEYDTTKKGKEAHDPLVDVKFQIEHLFAIKNRNKGNP